MVEITKVYVNEIIGLKSCLEEDETDNKSYTEWDLYFFNDENKTLIVRKTSYYQFDYKKKQTYRDYSYLDSNYFYENDMLDLSKHFDDQTMTDILIYSKKEMKEYVDLFDRITIIEFEKLINSLKDKYWKKFINHYDYYLNQSELKVMLNSISEKNEFILGEKKLNFYYNEEKKMDEFFPYKCDYVNNKYIKDQEKKTNEFIEENNTNPIDLDTQLNENFTPPIINSDFDKSSTFSGEKLKTIESNEDKTSINKNKKTPKYLKIFILTLGFLFVIFHMLYHLHQEDSFIGTIFILILTVIYLRFLVNESNKI